MGPNISVIIADRDKAADILKRCLESIDPSEMKKVRGELIIVDNGLADLSLDIIKDFRTRSEFPVKIVKEPKKGYANAKNVGIAASDGEIFIFIDSDCYVEKGYFLYASKIFNSGKFQYCGGRVLLYDKTDAMIAVKYETKEFIIPPKSFIPADTILGCNMLFKREVIDTIGFLDPLLGVGTLIPGADETDFITRASMAGFTGGYVPDLVVYHHHGRKEGSLAFKKAIKGYFYGIGAYFIKAILSGHFIHLKRFPNRLLAQVRRGFLKEFI